MFDRCGQDMSDLRHTCCFKLLSADVSENDFFLWSLQRVERCPGHCKCGYTCNLDGDSCLYCMHSSDGAFSRPVWRHERASGMVSSEPNSMHGIPQTGPAGSHPKQPPPQPL